MTGKLDPLGGTVRRLVAAFGKTVTLVRPDIIYDPNTGGTYSTETEFSVVVTPPREYSLERVDGTLIHAGDTSIGLPTKNAPVTPRESDKIRMDGNTWSIVQIEYLASGEEYAMYRLQLRK